MNFEKQKQEIMELFESAINDVLVFKKLRELKPPATPKCSTCKYFKPCNDEFTGNCDKPVTIAPVGLIQDKYNFGCIHHSDFEGVK